MKLFQIGFMASSIEKLKELSDLLDNNLISKTEFQQLKSEILNNKQGKQEVQSIEKSYWLGPFLKNNGETQSGFNKKIKISELKKNEALRKKVILYFKQKVIAIGGQNLTHDDMAVFDSLLKRGTLEKYERLRKKVVEPFAIVTLVTSIISLFLLPAIFCIICFISSLISFKRIKGNKKYKGRVMTFIGYILMFIGLFIYSHITGLKIYEIFTCFYFDTCDYYENFNGAGGDSF